MRFDFKAMYQHANANLRYIVYFALLELRASYRRTSFGKYWLAVQNLISSVALYLVFSNVFELTDNYLLYISVGLAFWGLLSNCLQQCSNMLVTGRNELLNSTITPNVFILRYLIRQFLDLCFVLIIPLTIYLVLNLKNPTPIIPGLLYFIILGLNFVIGTFSLSICIAYLGVFYRDIPQIIGNLIQLLFLITPVFWTIQNIGEQKFVQYNPAYHILHAPRCVLLNCPSQAIHNTVGISISVGFIFTALFCIKRYSKKITQVL